MSDDGRSQAATVREETGWDEHDVALPEGMTRTENGRPCMERTGVACLDFFYKVVPHISEDEFEELMQAAWEEDTVAALRLVFQTGNCRKSEGGKLDRNNFMRGLLFVYKRAPETLLANLREVVKQGCYKTLLDLLQAVLHEGSFEAGLQAAKAHKEHRAQIREKRMKGQRRREKEARQAELKRQFAAKERSFLGDLYAPVGLSLLGVQMGVPRAGHARSSSGPADQDVEEGWAVVGAAGKQQDPCVEEEKHTTMVGCSPIASSSPTQPLELEKTHARVLEQRLDRAAAAFQEAAEAPRSIRSVSHDDKENNGRNQMCDMNEEVPDEWEMWEDKMDAFCSSHAHVRRVPAYQGSFGVRKLVHVQRQAALSARNAERHAKRTLTLDTRAARDEHSRGDSYLQKDDPLLAAPCRGGKPVREPRRGLWMRNGGRWTSEQVRERFHEFVVQRECALRAAAREARRVREEAVVKRIASMTVVESRLHEAVAEIFATDLANEREQHVNGAKSISALCAKWAPKCGQMHDKNTHIVDAIIAKLPASFLNSNGSTPRIRYQQVCAELRRAAKVPEAFVGRAEWACVEYNRMPSLCRKVWGEKVWRKYDRERYDSFLQEARESIERGDKKARVHCGALLPHQVVMSASESVEADLQWHGLVTRLQAAVAEGAHTGIFIPVCDVSGSMHGEPMEVAIALSLLIAESVPRDSPMHGKVFTFDSTPRLLTVPDIPDHAGGQVPSGGLARRVQFVRSMPWGMSTNIDAVFDMLLGLCVSNHLTTEQVKGLHVCVFSDMQFDQAYQAATPWETAHEGIVRKWREAGYETAPIIVYWNLRAARGTPVEANTKGVVMLSGFSSLLMEAFLSGRLEDVTPVAQMAAVLGKECYARLRIAPA